MSFGKRFGIGLKYGIFCIVVGYITIGFYYFLDSQSFLIAKNDEAKVNDVYKDLMEMQPNAVIWGVIFIYTVFLGPISEEIIFRFFPINITKLCTKNETALWGVILVVSGIFGLLHSMLPMLFTASILGIILSKSYIEGGLVASSTSHILFNALGVLYAILSHYHYLPFPN